MLSSLHFIRTDFLPLGRGPHPIWTSRQSSSSAVNAAVIQARLLSGRYRTDYLASKWTGESGCCTLPGCGAMPGDTVHLLSGQCPALRKFLASSLAHGLNTLGSHPLLLKAAENALMSSPEDWVQFILKPSANPAIIELRQKLGPQSIWPIF